MTFFARERGVDMFAVNVLFLVLTVPTVLLRCYVRAKIIRSFGWDDWLMIVAQVLFISYFTSSYFSIYYGDGAHTADLTKEEVQKSLMYWWFCAQLYGTTMIVAKISFAFFLLRFMVTRTHIWIIYGAAFCTVVGGAALVFVFMFRCWPVSYYWDKDQQGKCLDMRIIIIFAFLYSAFSFVTDAIFVLMPGFLIWSHTQLTRREKFAAMILIGMGCIACFAVAIRAAYLHKFHDPDFLWATLDISLWTTVEMGLAICAASLATLKPLIKFISAKFELFVTSRCIQSISSSGSGFRYLADAESFRQKPPSTTGECLENSGNGK